MIKGPVWNWLNIDIIWNSPFPEIVALGRGSASVLKRSGMAQ
jgi:hypothetical protein